MGDIAVVRLPGEHPDAGNAQEFKRRLAAILASHTKVVFDMQQLRFVDSAGLGAFLSCLRQLHAAGGGLKVYGMQRPVQALFELVRMQRLVTAFDTKEEALRAFQSRETA